MITAQQLNQVSKLLGTTDKSVVYGAVIKTLTEAGMTTRQAFDELFGAGAYEKTAGDIYDAIRA